MTKKEKKAVKSFLHAVIAEIYPKIAHYVHKARANIAKSINTEQGKS